jgi:dihydrodipicolinate synthase/N-acetylneuraminate lyase
MNAEPGLTGVLPVLQTPFSESDDIDYDVLEREARWLLEMGADGIVVGMVSEVLRLSERERDELGQFLGALAAAADTHFVMSVGAESTKVAVLNGQRAEENGATEVMAIPPISVALPESEIYEYYRALISGLSIPVIVQDASGYVGSALSIELMARLQDEFGPRVLFKPEAQPIGPRLTLLRDATARTAQIYEGTGGISLIDSMRRGIAGTMPGSDVCWSIIEMWRAGQAGDFARAYQIQGPLLALLTIQNTLDAFLAVEKHLLVKQGIFKNTKRRTPVGFVMDEETTKEIDRAFEALLQVCGR